MDVFKVGGEMKRMGNADIGKSQITTHTGHSQRHRADGAIRWRTAPDSVGILNGRTRQWYTRGRTLGATGAENLDFAS